MSLKRKLDHQDADSQIESDRSGKQIKLTVKERQCAISNVPEECIIKIFSYLGYKDLSKAALVCKDWRSLSLAPELWRNINLSGRSDMNSTTVEKLLKRSKGIRRIILWNCILIGDSVILEISKQTKLQTLNLGRTNRCEKLSPGIIRSIANCQSLLHLCLRGHEVKDDDLEIIAKSCTSLAYLDITECSDVTTKGLLPVIQHCTQLKCLMLINCQKVDDEFLSVLASEQKNQLEFLVIIGINFSMEGLMNLRKMPKLKMLDASNVGGMCDFVVSTLSNLTFLALDLDQNITNDGVSVVVRKNPNLEVLGLHGCRSIDDNALEMILKSPCRSTLKVLVINDCLVSENAISLILKNCTNLRTLSFSKIEKETVNKWQTEYPNIRMCTKSPQSGDFVQLLEFLKREDVKFEFFPIL